MDFGYIRVSTSKQNLGRQTEEMSKLKLDKVYSDKLSGKSTNRPELQKMMETVRAGDTVTVLSIDRLGRNGKDVLDIVTEIKNKGAVFKCLSPAFDTTTPFGDFFLWILAAVAQMDRANILERQRQGIELARQLGKYKGRRPKQLENFEGVYQQWIDGKVSMEQAGKILGVSRATFYRRVKAYEDRIIVDFGLDDNVA